MTDKEYYDNESLCNEDFDFDVYITGSDQVWNINCVDADDAYFLNFVKQGKKLLMLHRWELMILKKHLVIRINM
ncbi:hypothetical protein [Candidatus Bacteroides intestinigallinarum]|uniref:hypothetical protein n=1 Tax=Candidatus Bacteroides intestinigallinarum TaxID=2838470 RepID=UPI0021657025|nr:hypothetical protein [Candidatus Bacteroides intestinigallinarum]MCS3200180.1 hypothetical protein [Candidatus Bacteroides intestinigallinarum]